MTSLVRPPKPPRIRKIQWTTLSFLLMAGIINFLDRSSLSIANTTIRSELGLSATQIGALLSAFSLAYGLALALAWYPLNRDRRQMALTATEAAYLGTNGGAETNCPISPAEWQGLFRLRSMWGM